MANPYKNTIDLRDYFASMDAQGPIETWEGFTSRKDIEIAMVDTNTITGFINETHRVLFYHFVMTQLDQVGRESFTSREFELTLQEGFHTIAWILETRFWTNLDV